jgi:ribose-phosphate pyrophosphokinase
MIYKTWQYSGGEVGVRIETTETQNTEIPTFRIQSSNDLVATLMALDAYSHESGTTCTEVCIPYLPYARQDRVVTKGDPFAIQVVAKMLSSVGVTKVHSYDVHSKKGVEAFKEVGVELISIAPTDFIKGYIQWMGTEGKVAFIAPDAGAREKTENYCRGLSIHRAIQCFKKRDPQTGALQGFTIDEESSATSQGLKRDNIYDLVITDDICDGGGTFLGVAEAIKSHYGDEFKLHLWTTHGIYSKGIDILLEKFDTLGCSNSFSNNITHPKLYKI